MFPPLNSQNTQSHTVQEEEADQDLFQLEFLCAKRGDRLLGSGILQWTDL